MIYLIAVGCSIGNYLLFEVFMSYMQLSTKKVRIVVIGICSVFSIIFSLLFENYGYGPVKIIKYCLLMGGLILIAYEDMKEKRIPNRWLLYLTGIRVMLFVIETILYPTMLIENMKFTCWGGVVSGLVLFLAYVISRHEIGLGDVKLFVVIGLYLGVSVTYFVMLLSLIIAAVYGGFNLIVKRLNAKDEIAFGPFVAIGTVIILGLGF